MNIRDFKVGMLIRISNDPSESIRLFMGGPTKRKLASTIQRISKTKYAKNAVCITNCNDYWTFHLNDITLVDQDCLIPKAELFNPNQLLEVEDD